MQNIMHSSNIFYTMFQQTLDSDMATVSENYLFFLWFDVKVYASLFVLTERKQKKDDDEMMEGSCLSSPPPLPLSHFSPPSGVVC